MKKTPRDINHPPSIQEKSKKPLIFENLKKNLKISFCKFIYNIFLLTYFDLRSYYIFLPNRIFLSASDDGVRLAFIGEILRWTELSVSSFAQNGEFFNQFLSGGITFGLTFCFDIGFATLQAAVDQQANILSGGFGFVPIASAGGFVSVVGIENRLFELLAFCVAGGRRIFADFLQAREFGFDISIADDIFSGVQNGFGFDLLFGIRGIVASANASLDGSDFSAILIPFFRMQSRYDRARARIAFGQRFAEFFSFRQHLREPIAIFLLHDASSGASVANAGQMGLRVVGHGESRTG
jgi:hypothetical protein